MKRVTPAKIASVGFVLCVGLSAIAQDSSTSSATATENAVKIQDVTDDTNKTPGPDVDQTITNNLMRAQSGSKSRWSVATQFAYNGGSVDTPLGENRPNIMGGNGNTIATQLVGDVSGKFNIDQMHSILLGFGIRWTTPFYKGVPANYTGEKFDADNPYATYQYVYKWSGVQSVLQAGAKAYTASDLLNKGFVAGVSVNQNNVYQFGHSGFSLGAQVEVDAAYYDRNTGNDSAGNPVLPQQTDYQYSFFPFAEYQFTDKLNLRTGVGFYFEHTRNVTNAWTFQKDKVYQSVGLGISVTRDIFLYPNIQFIPDQLRAKDTNVALVANVNIF